MLMSKFAGTAQKDHIKKIRGWYFTLIGGTNLLFANFYADLSSHQINPRKNDALS